MITCFSQLTIIRPFPQNSEQGSTQFKEYFGNMGSHKVCTALHCVLSCVEMAWWWSVDRNTLSWQKKNKYYCVWRKQKITSLSFSFKYNGMLPV